jgi:hypothetical protein
MYKKILIANNGSDGSFKALVEALRLSRANKSEAHMIYRREPLLERARGRGQEKDARSEICGIGGKGRG